MYIFQVISNKTKVRFSEKMIDICKHTLPEGSPPHIKAVCSTFVRKYIHARVGGHIRGNQERDSEKRGVRAKGGCSLRDKLYNLSGKSKSQPNTAKAKSVKKK